MQIELDSTGEGDEIAAAFLSTRDNNVEVRYALAEAIKFSPLKELAGQEWSLRSQAVMGGRFLDCDIVLGGYAGSCIEPYMQMKLHLHTLL